MFPAVQTAKERLLNSYHEYLPILGYPAFRDESKKLIFGKDAEPVKDDRVCFFTPLDDQRSSRSYRLQLRKHFQELDLSISQELFFAEFALLVPRSTSPIQHGATIEQYLRRSVSLSRLTSILIQPVDSTSSRS